MNLWDRYYTVRSMDEAIELLGQNEGAARIVAGATDLIIELEAGIRPDLGVMCW